MYPPPSLEIFYKLMRGDIEQIAYSLSVLSICFEKGDYLGIEAPFRFSKKEKISDSPVLDFPLAESQLMRLLGCKIVHINCDTDGTLELDFSNGDVLIVYANDPMYEAYTLSIDGKNYVV